MLFFDSEKNLPSLSQLKTEKEEIDSKMYRLIYIYLILCIFYFKIFYFILKYPILYVSQFIYYLINIFYFIYIFINYI